MRWFFRAPRPEKTNMPTCRLPPLIQKTGALLVLIFVILHVTTFLNEKVSEKAQHGFWSNESESFHASNYRIAIVTFITQQQSYLHLCLKNKACKGAHSSDEPSKFLGKLTLNFRLCSMPCL
jgi:hypothetical protein